MLEYSRCKWTNAQAELMCRHADFVTHFIHWKVCHFATEVHCPHVVTLRWVSTQPLLFVFISACVCVCVCVCVWQRETYRQAERWKCGLQSPYICLPTPTWNAEKEERRCLVWGSMVTHILASTTPPEASHYVRLHNHPRDQSYMIRIHHIKRPRLLL